MLLAQPPAVRFTEVAAQAGLARCGDPGAVAWFDVDADGDEDLFVARLGGRDRLYRNDGGVFTRLKHSGIEGEVADSFGAAVADYDNDGRLDLFVARVGARSSLYHNEGAGLFRDVTRQAGLVTAARDSFSAAWADYDRDGLVDLYVANGSQIAAAPNLLYHNQGGGRFVETAATVGVAGNERSLGCAWGDFDGDLWPDLCVVNFGQPTRLYRNLGTGSFREVGVEAGVAGSANGAGCAWGDYDNDLDLDLYVFNTNEKANRDRLYRNDGGGRFHDITAEAGLLADEDGEAVVWGDFDADGWLDLYVVNRSGQPNRLFLNRGGAAFVDFAESAGVAGNGRGHPAAAADVDGDGKLDLFVGNLPDRAEMLFHNDSTPATTLEITLAGTTSNTAAIGARVIVTSASGAMLREVSSSSGRSSQGQLAAHFGLPAGGPVRVEVRWPDGGVDLFDGVLPGCYLLVEGGPLSSRLQVVHNGPGRGGSR